MNIGQAHAVAPYRGPAPIQNAFAHAAVESRVTGEADNLIESDRASAAKHKPLDAAQVREVDERGPEPEDAKRAEEASGEKKPGGSQELDETDKRVVESLQRRDREVRAHEAAHMAAAGAYAAGGPTYTTEQGPDGRSYVIGGEVPIDMSPERTPEATLRKAQTVRAAAMAPADPSGADKAIAAAASQMAEAAQAAIAEESVRALEEAREVVTKEDTKPAPETEADDESSGPSAASTEGFAALKDGLSDIAPPPKTKASANKRGQLSKAYVAMAQTPARATLRCASCSAFH